MLLLIFLCALSWLNDFAFMRLEHSYVYSLMLDYGLRGFVLWLLYASPAARRAVVQAWRPTNLWPTLFWIGAIVAVSQLGELLEPWIAGLAPGLPFHGFPPPRSVALHAIDLTLGLALVALSEEFVGRVYFRAVMEPLLPNRTLLVLVSALVFALAHWSQGPGGLVSTFLVGVVLMAAYLRLGSIGPCVVAHYLANLLIFW